MLNKHDLCAVILQMTLFVCCFVSLDLVSGGFPDSSVGKESACNTSDLPGLGRSAREGIGYPLQYSWASLVAQLVKNLPAVWETWFDPWIEKIPWRRERLPTPVFWPGEFHGLYSPWSLKESDRTERLSLLLSVSGASSVAASGWKFWKVLLIFWYLFSNWRSYSPCGNPRWC